VRNPKDFPLTASGTQRLLDVCEPQKVAPSKLFETQICRDSN